MRIMISSLVDAHIAISQAIIPYVPTESPTLGHLVYEMILAYFLAHDRQVPFSSTPFSLMADRLL